MKKIAIIALAIICYAADSYSQTLFNKIKSKVVKTASEKIERGIEKPDTRNEEQEKEEVKTSSASSSKSENVQSAEEEPKKETLSSRTRFDFVPGEKVIFWEDFSQEAVGEFPSKWFTRSKGETVTLNTTEGKWLRMYPGGFLSPTVSMKENYTVEFDLIMDWPLKGGFLVPSFGVSFYDRGNKMAVFSYDYTLENNMAFHLTPFRSEAYLTLSTRENRKSKFDSEKVKISAFDKKSGVPVHVAISVQQERIRMWLDEEKVFDIPSAAPYPGNINQLKVEMNTSNYTNEQIGYYVTNFKVASGVPDLKSKLVTEGKLSTTGIRFDVNSDNIRQESFGTINGIAKVLKDNPDMKVRIVGHTDNSGAASDNVALSKKRADAVVKVLTASYEVPAAQLESDGKGSSIPAGDNKTPEGKAANRRVEFIKI